MLEIDPKTKANRCGRCSRKFGLGEPVKWQETRENGQTIWQIWCVLCIEDMSIGDNLDWDKGAWFACDDCRASEMVEVAEMSGWHTDPDFAGVFCQFCAQVRRGRANDPIPLSCLPKTQEIADLTGNPRRIPPWLHGTVLMILFVSIGLNWLPLVLSSALVYLAMGIWKRLERTKTPTPLRPKREEPKCPF